MPDKNTIKQLENSGFRYYKDSIESNVAYQGSKVNVLKERFHELVEDRGFPNTTVRKVRLSNSEFSIVSHKIAKDVEVHVAVLLEEFGKDLRISISFGQFDNGAKNKQFTIGLVLTSVGAFLLVIGGFIPLIIGVIMLIGAKNKFRSEYESERNNFFTTVLEIFSHACDEAEVDFEATSMYTN